MRRKQNSWLRKLDDFDRALVPHRLECTFNNVWSWGRDGHQVLVFPDDDDSSYWLKLHRK
jgi:hypothetical protein